MKNKIAERVKKKRRAERAAAEKAEQDRIMREFDKAAREKGLKKYKRDDILRAWKIADRELTKKAIVYTIVTISYCLHKYHGWGKRRLWKFVSASHKYILIVGNQERSISQLKEELKTDAGVDFKPFDEYLPSDIADGDGKIIAQKISYIMPMAIYTLYYDEGWKKKRMNRVVSQIIALLDMVIEKNEIEKLRSALVKECGIRIDDDGSVRMMEV